MNSHLWWYTARAAGAVTWALSGAAILVGVLASSRGAGLMKAEPSKSGTLHRWLGMVCVVFAGLHLAGLALDESSSFGPRELFVPMASTWYPAATAWGIVAFYLLVAVAISSLLRRFIGDRSWTLVHYLSFALFILGTVHGLKVGTDAQSAAIWWPVSVLSAGVIGFAVSRILGSNKPVPVEAPAAASSARPDVSLIERTLEGLRALDDETTQAPPAVVPPALAVDSLRPPTTDVLPSRPAEPQIADLFPAADEPERSSDAIASMFREPVTLTPDQSVSTSIFPTLDEMLATAPTDALTSTSNTPSIDDRTFTAITDNWGAAGAPAPTTDHAAATPPTRAVPTLPPTPASPESIDSAPPFTGGNVTLPGGPTPRGDLPIRTPRRLVRTTAAAERIDSWKPATAPLTPAVAPPEPPTALDGTGEPDPQAYRQWLRDWLAYVESQA